jgi:hypothetical protein
MSHLRFQMTSGLPDPLVWTPQHWRKDEQTIGSRPGTRRHENPRRFINLQRL